MLNAIFTYCFGEDDPAYSLFIAATFNDIKCIQKLLKQQAFIDVATSDNNAVLAAAARNGRAKIVEALLAIPAVVAMEADTTKIYSATKEAAERGHVGVVKLLLANEDIKQRFMDQDLDFLKTAILKKSKALFDIALESTATQANVVKAPISYLRLCKVTANADFESSILELLPEDRRELTLTELSSLELKASIDKLNSKKRTSTQTDNTEISGKKRNTAT